jgi:hypothetical protein
MCSFFKQLVTPVRFGKRQRRLKEDHFGRKKGKKEKILNW